jgi:methylmalonyl-CoA mutase N-terminal domain/subunit
MKKGISDRPETGRGGAGDRHEEIRQAHSEWAREAEKTPERAPRFMTASSDEIEPIYLPTDREGSDYMRDLGFPGSFPYTRGVYPNMYRGRLWTMRMFAGFGTAEDTNQRFKYLLEHGQTGLSTAFDLPTLYGYDSDHSFSDGEVGRCGVAIDSLEDMEILFDGIDLGEVSTSMTINSPAAILLAFYVAVAEKQGVPIDRLSGTTQNDILKEYIAQKEYIFPPEPSMRLITDTVEFCTRQMPRWHPISISGYHIREAGSTAAQELAFTLADGFAYVEAALDRGLDVDDFAPRLSFFFNAHNDFFEEIAKYRAARRIYARRMRDRYGAKNPRSLLMRFHTQTAGCTLTAQQPENNIVRVTIQALAGVMGGTQSLHTNSMDETLALPSDKAAKIALRTQQIIAQESGVTNTIDPLAGSYFLESLTEHIEKEAEEYFERIDSLGGVVAGIEKGFFQQEIARAAYRYQVEIDDGERIIVGVNEYVEEKEGIEIPLLEITEEIRSRQIDRLSRLRERRDNGHVSARLSELREVCEQGGNVMPTLIEASKAYCTLGEMVDVMRDVFGTYRESTTF